jgi:hypothetical protein
LDNGKRPFWRLTKPLGVAVLYSRLQHQAAPYRNTAGTFIFADDSETLIRPVDIGTQVAAQ